MEKLIRTEQPQWLSENWARWGMQWKKKYRPGKSFSWHGERKRQDLCSRLSKMTKHHCSFCDVFEMGSDVRRTIEHFRPKSKFPLLAYQWENLFICFSINGAKEVRLFKNMGQVALQ